MVPTRADLDALEIGVAPAGMPEKHIPQDCDPGLHDLLDQCEISRR